MFRNLIITLITVSLFLINTAVGQEIINKEKNIPLSSDVKKAAEKLLFEIAEEVKELKVEENRIQAATIIAGLMWEKDEKAARGIFQNVLGELQTLLNTVSLPTNLDEMSRSEKSEFFSKRHKIAELRREFLLVLAAHNPQSALAYFDILKVKVFDEYDPLRTNQLELEMASVIAHKNSDKSYEIAKRLLDTNGVSYEFVQTLKKLHSEDSTLSARLGKETLALLKTLKIRVPSDVAKTSNTPLDPKKEINFWQLSYFIRILSEINFQIKREKYNKNQPILNNFEMKELIELSGNAFLATENPLPSAISEVMAEINTYAPSIAQRIRQKIGEENAKQLDKTVESNSFYNLIILKTSDELLADAELSAPDVRDQRLAAAANKAIKEGNAEKAQAIATRINNRKNHEYLFETIKAAIPLTKARRGDRDVDKILSLVKTDREKVKILTELARAVIAKGDRETAKKILSDYNYLLPSNLQNYIELESAILFASVYSLTDSQKAFTILENASSEMKEYIIAGIKIDDFNLVETIKKDELLFSVINRQFFAYPPNVSDVIENLARADFNRTVAFADKFQRPEIRQFIRLRIVQSLLDKDSLTKEQKIYQRITEEEEEEH